MSDRYINKTYVGSGAMATVYRAWDTVMERNVALKEVAQELRGQKEISNLMLNEAQKIARIKHPNVVQIYDIFYDNDIPTIVQEFVGGGSLASSVGASFCSVDVVLKVLDEVFAGLGAIHSAGLIHRDIKPDNLLSDEGSWKLVDFGVAMSGDEEVIPFVGSKYAAPEILLSPNDITTRCDFYSAGVMAMELLLGSERLEAVARDATSRATGSSGADNPNVFWQKWTYSQIEWPRLDAVDNRFSAPLADLIARLVSLDQQARPSSCDEVRAAVRQLKEQEAMLMAAPTLLASGEPAQSRSLDTKSGGTAKKKQPLWFKLLAGTLGTLLVGLGALLLVAQLKPPPAPVSIASAQAFVEALQAQWVNLPALELDIPTAETAEGGQQLRVGAPIVVQVTPATNGHISVLHLSADDVVTIVYPSPAEQSDMVQATQLNTLAEELDLIASEPLGPDYVVAFVTPEPVNLGISEISYIPVKDWGRALILPDNPEVSTLFTELIAGQNIIEWAIYPMQIVPVDLTE